MKKRKRKTKFYPPPIELVPSLISHWTLYITVVVLGVLGIYLLSLVHAEETELVGRLFAYLLITMEVGLVIYFVWSRFDFKLRLKIKNNRLSYRTKKSNFLSSMDSIRYWSYKEIYGINYSTAYISLVFPQKKITIEKWSMKDFTSLKVFLQNYYSDKEKKAVQYSWKTGKPL